MKQNRQEDNSGILLKSSRLGLGVGVAVTRVDAPVTKAITDTASGPSTPITPVAPNAASTASTTTTSSNRLVPSSTSSDTATGAAADPNNKKKKKPSTGSDGGASVDNVGFTTPTKSEDRRSPVGEADFAKLGPRWKASDFNDKVAARLLNHGKFADLYLVEHKRTKKKYVVKTFPLAHVHEAYREARIHMALKHPRIVEMYAYLWEPNYVGLVMEFVDGGDIFDTLLATRQQPHAVGSGTKVWRIFGQLCEALAHLHKIGIVHTDIKPENVLIDSQRESIKLTDFDSAIVLSEEKQTTGISGTTFFLPPEGVELCVKKTLCASRQQQQQHERHRRHQNHHHRPPPPPPNVAAADKGGTAASCSAAPLDTKTLTSSNTLAGTSRGAGACGGTAIIVGGNGGGGSGGGSTCDGMPAIQVHPGFDMWGVGIMLFEFCTLQLPFFGGRQHGADGQEHLDDFIMALEDMKDIERSFRRCRRYGRLPEELRKFIAQLCHTEPGKRMQAAAAAARFASPPSSSSSSSSASHHHGARGGGSGGSARRNDRCRTNNVAHQFHSQYPYPYQHPYHHQHRPLEFHKHHTNLYGIGPATTAQQCRRDRHHHHTHPPHPHPAPRKEDASRSSSDSSATSSSSGSKR